MTRAGVWAGVSAALVALAWAGGEARHLADLADPAIDESSGLAAGRANPDLLWTHNDSGDRPRLFAIDRAGRTRANLLLSGALAFDWEDLAAFRLDGRAYLLAADVGDNGRQREFVTLWLAVEPDLAAAEPPKLEAVRAIHYRYPDGPHDCESVAVDPTTRTIYVVAKVLQQPSCTVYRLPIPATSPPEPLVAEPVAELRLPPTTAMDISPDGRRAIVLTYGDAFEYRRGADEGWAEGFARAPRRLRMPRRRQGEAICYGPEAKVVYLTSEKLPAPLFEVTLPPLEGE